MKYAIIDSFALMFRAFYALPSLTTQAGQPSGAIFGMAKFLTQIMRIWKPDFLIAVVDKASPTFRHELYDGYKANRTQAPDEFISQIEPIFELLTLMGIPMYGVPGYEADDVACTLARKLESEQADEVLLFTGDSDYLQLVDERVRIVMPQIGFQKTKIYDVEAVYEKWGIRPNQVIDFKSLVGDTSDNIPGVRGIGPKTATHLLQQFDTLEGVFGSLSQVSPKQCELLEQGRDSAFFSRELVKMCAEVPLDDWKMPDCFEIPNFGTLENFLVKYDCLSVIPQMSKIGISDEVGLVSGPKKHHKKEPSAEQIDLFSLL